VVTLDFVDHTVLIVRPYKKNNRKVYVFTVKYKRV